MAKIDELYVKAGVDTKTLERGLRDFERKTQTSMQKVAGSFRAVDDRVGKLERSIFSFRNLAIAGMVVGIGHMVTRSLNFADSLDKTSEKLGVNVESLQEFRYAASQAGIAQNTFDMALQRFVRRAAEASQGTGEALAALNELGVAVKDNNGNLRSADAMLSDVADAFKNLKDPADRVRLAFKLFDSEGVSMVNMLKDGSTALDTMRQKARDLGLVMDEELIKNAVKAKDDIETLGYMIGVRLTKAIAEAAPALQRIVNAIAWLIEPFEAPGSDLNRIEGITAELEKLAAKEAEILSGGDKTAQYMRDRFGMEMEPSGALNQIDKQRMVLIERQKLLEAEQALADASERVEFQRIETAAELKKKQTEAEKAAKEAAARAKALNDAWRQDIEEMREALKKEQEELAKIRYTMPSEAAADFERRKHEAREAYKQGMDEIHQEGLAKEKEHLRNIQSAWTNAFQNIGDSLVDILTDSTKSSSEKMKAIMFNALNQIAQALAVSLSGGQSASPYSGLGNMVAGWFTGGGGGSSPGQTPGIVAPQGGGIGDIFSHFAGGGVPDVGRISMVGERGPELFVPNVGGRVLSREDSMRAVSAANGNGGGGGTYYIDARGADQAGIARLEKLIVSINGSIERRALSAVSSDMRRNGALRRQIG